MFWIEAPRVHCALSSRCSCLLLYLASGSSLFGWIFTSMFFPGTTRKVLPRNQAPCLFTRTEWQNPEQQRFLYFYLFCFFPKPSSSITLTQAMYGDSSFTPTLTPRLFNYQYKREYVSKIKLWSQNQGTRSFLYLIATHIAFFFFFKMKESHNYFGYFWRLEIILVLLY